MKSKINMDSQQQSEVVKILHHTRSDDFHTHVSLIHPLGKYNIERSNLENFWTQTSKA